MDKKDKVVVDMINEMFRIAGHDVTYDDIKDRKDNWYQQWTMTEAQYDEWKSWGEKYLRKKIRMTAIGAQREMSFIGLMWGLKFDNI